ncbi:DUF1801 domain-containing protein [Alkalibacter rhizosphaerae]|uniref:DUF1801 domain-containing protein n=1 Tax=Alkalibacter rhizosphaerae TaxID=2815577 RepID=A0A974XG32_9FIRM|nr:DUF1801 domain-containing protein [Alkalibacter rhizosphaerae]QSX09212.1 DUF1801 domain-containing protein [Alkalibacter rhizosphaerae]
MKEFKDFMDAIDDPAKRERMEKIFEHIAEQFPSLETEVKWNQPMFVDHGTFIIAFSIAKQHMAVAPERVALDKFEEAIQKAGYQRTKELFKIRWKDEVDYDLLDDIIRFNMEDKKDWNKFWR